MKTELMFTTMMILKRPSISSIQNFTICIQKALLPLKHHVKSDNRKIPWITKGILISRTETKNIVYKKYLSSPTSLNETNYKKHRNQFNKFKEATKKSYYDEKFNEHKGNLKLTWKLISISNSVICGDIWHKYHE